MATKEHWNVDPWNDAEIWSKLIGKEQEDTLETLKQYDQIFGNQYGARCLEIGAGVGRLLRFAGRSFHEAWGVDSSPVMVALSTRYLQVSDRIRVVFGDGNLLPFPTNWFSFVYSFTCFQHMPDLATVTQNLQEARRVLDPGGICKIQTVCGDRGEPGRYDGYVFLSESEFGMEMMNAGFTKVVTDRIGEWIWATGEKA